MLKKIIKDFNRYKKQNPNLGEYVALCYCVIKKNYNSATIKSAFKKLMPKDEYDTSEQKEYIYYLYKISNRPK